MAWVKVTPADTSTAAAVSAPPDGTDTDTASSGATGSHSQVRISVTYDLDCSASGTGANSLARWQYSTNGGSTWTTGVEISCVTLTSPQADDGTDIVNLGAADLSNIQVRSYAEANQGFGGSSSATADIDDWFMEYLDGRRSALVD